MALSFLSVVLQNLNSLIQKEVGLILGVEKEMKKLSSMLSTIEAVLEDAEQKKLQDKALQNWLRKLKDLAYEVDDILDECATKSLRWESEGQTCGSLHKVSTSLLTSCTVKNIRFRHKIGNRMKEIIENLDAIAEERIKFHLSEAIVEKRIDFAERRETSSILTEPQVYGRDEDKEKIVKVLVEDEHDFEDVVVYPIIGMGGLGKTTLAQMVFNDERVKRHFKHRIWVHVSEDFDMKRVTKEIAESIASEVPERSSLDFLQEKLRDVINGERYLIILDDVWNEDQEIWNRFKYGLACGSKGSSIITTTRLEKVASIMGTLPPHWLSFLSEDHCWLLFKQRAFGSENVEHPKLVAIGKEIVKKCGGVPLAAKALGGLLRFKREVNEWLFIKDSEIWNLPHDENSILPALKLSYYNLPLELRRCFGYCAVFPKGFQIDKEYLIHLWMANGFISSNGRLELEDIGNGIWNELYWRSFFQDLVKDKFGNIKFKMHDLMHDLAQSVMEYECHIMEAKSSSNIPNQRIRHVTLVADRKHLGVFPVTLHGVESLRTILLQYRQPLSTGSGSMVPPSPPFTMPEFSCDLTNFGSLRVFDVRGARMKQLSSSIGNLTHLRYLNLSHTVIRTLPTSIRGLCNLQTLNLIYCRELQRLPKNLKYLTSLRHLYLEGCESIHSMPPKLGQLTLLKTLNFFIVGKGTGFRLAELQHLDLGGKLRIECLERVRNSMDAKETNLIGKKNLRIVELSWKGNSGSEPQENVEQVFEALEPHPNVEELIISNYRGAHFPIWMGDSSKNIVDIQLYGCINCLLLPALGQLPSLRRLGIYRMDYVEFIDNVIPSGVPVRGFPSLEALEISDLPNLKGLSREEGIDLFPRLRKINITECPKLTLPHLSSPESLKVESCGNVVLSSISNLNRLTSLEVAYDEDVISFPEEMLQNLTALESLDINEFSKLKLLPTNLANLVSLKSLSIRWCDKLESLPDQGLRSLKSLRHLEIRCCNNFSYFPESFGHLTGLEKLYLLVCPKLVDLPESIKHLNSLRHIIISGKFETWPEALQHVPALQSLSIPYSPELASLPEWWENLTSLQSLSIWDSRKIAALPDSIQSLTNLQNLNIWQCTRELARRCEKEKGEDWYKIAHVPKVIVKTHL